MSTAVQHIGIVGTGRLGKVLTRRLRDAYRVSNYDKDVKLAKQFSKLVGTTFLYPDELVRQSDLVLLCIPGDQVVGWLKGLDPADRPRPLFVNMATDLPTFALRRDPELQGLRVVGLKPLVQFAALDRGLPGLFVTSPEAAAPLPLLVPVFESLGRVVVGDEDAVGPFNREATAAALRFCREFTCVAEQSTEKVAWIEAALKNVIVGTILDYPPDPNNEYTNRLLYKHNNGVPRWQGTCPETCHP